MLFFKTEIFNCWTLLAYFQDDFYDIITTYFQFGEISPEEMPEHDVWYGIDRPPSEGSQLKEFLKKRQVEDGYLTMITVRHPLARLYSAWKDKFRKNHPWLKVIFF